MLRPPLATELPSDLGTPTPSDDYRAAVTQWMAKGVATVSANSSRPKAWAAYRFQDKHDGDTAHYAYKGFRDLCSAFGGSAAWGGRFDGREVWPMQWSSLTDEHAERLGDLVYKKCGLKGHPVNCPLEYFVVCQRPQGPFAAMVLDERASDAVVLEHYSLEDLSALHVAEDQHREERRQADLELQENVEAQVAAEAASFRQQLKPGDRVGLPQGTRRKQALVIELRPPLAHVQTYNPPTDLWIAIESLFPPRPVDEP